MTRVQKILLWATPSGFLAVGLFGPIYAIFVKDIGGDLLEAGAAYGLFYIISGVFVFSLGRWQFFKSHLRGMVILGYGLFVVANASYLFVSRPMHLFIVQIIFGVAYGILEPSWDGLFSVDLKEDSATQLWSMWAAGRDIFSGIGAFLGGAIVAAFSFKFLFILMTILAAITMFISLGLINRNMVREKTLV